MSALRSIHSGSQVQCQLPGNVNRGVVAGHCLAHVQVECKLAEGQSVEGQPMAYADRVPLIAEIERLRNSKVTGLILFLAQHLPRFQIDQVHSRAADARK